MSKENKSMKKKISIGLIIAIIILATVYSLNVVIGKTVTIGNKAKSKDGGDYINKFVKMSENNFYNLKWNDIKDYYYTASGTYESYTANQQRVICMNEGKADWYSEYEKNNYQRALRPAAIIDIEGGYVTVQGTIAKNNDKTYVGKDAARLAYAAYDEGRRVTWLPEAFVNYGKGWLNFYTAADEVIDISKEPSLEATNKSTTYANEYQINDPSLYAEISTSGDGVGTTIDNGIKKELGSFDGGTYQTKIGPYSLSGVSDESKVTKTVKVSVGKKTYTGIIKEQGDNYYLYFVEKIDGIIDSIKFTQSYKGYKSRILILATNYSQSRAIMLGKKDQTIKYEVNLRPPQQEVDVSLQKYIIKVNDHTLTSNETELVNRMNKMTASDENSDKVKKQISKNNTATDEYKRGPENLTTNTVNIELGDTVTYRVRVYNNTDIVATNVLVKDRLPYYEKDGNVVSYVEIVNIKDKNGTDITNQWTIVENPNEDNLNTYKHNIASLSANSNTYFDITVRYTSKSTNKDKIYTNTAWISTTDLTNKSTYRTADRDYVKMKEYAVSLEKYISGFSENLSSGGTSVDSSRYNEIKKYLGETKTVNKLKELTNNSDINGDGNVDNFDLQLMQRYLDIGNNINKLSNINKEDLISNYQKADINNDGIVDGTDIMIFGIINGRSEEVKELIEQYIKLDINKDGYFNEEDSNIYKETLSDINGDLILDTTDKLLSLIYSKEIGLESDNSNKLDIQKIKTYYIGDNREKIKNYIISDVNKDGIVDQKDKEFWEEHYNDHIKDVDTVENNNIKIANIQDFIKNYDYNEDNRVNIRDIEAIRNNNNVDNKDDIIAVIENAIASADYDIDDNNSIEGSTFKLLVKYEGDENFSEFNPSIENQIAVEIKEKIAGDILILQCRNNLINFEMQDLEQDQINEIVNECSENNKDYYLYDVNTDSIITQEDFDKYNELYENIDEISELIEEEDFISKDEDKEFLIKLDEHIKTLGNIDFEKVKDIISNFYNEDITEDSYFGSNDIDNIKDNNRKEEILKRDLNNDNIIDYKDHEIYNTYVRFINSPNAEVDEPVELIYHDYVVNTEFNDQEKQWLLNGGYSNDKNLNIDGDTEGKITQEDYDLLNNNLKEEYINKCNTIGSSSKIEAVKNYDLDNNNQFDQMDLELINKYNSDNLYLNPSNNYFNNDGYNLLREVVSIDWSSDDIYQTIIDIITTGSTSTHEREGRAEYLTLVDGVYEDKTDKDTTWTRHNTYKYDRVITVSNGNYVTYTIKVKNDGGTIVKNMIVEDTLPSGVEFVEVRGIGISSSSVDNKVTITVNGAMTPGSSVSFDIVVKVTERNISTSILQNNAKITDMQNNNNQQVTDTTPYNNEDNDYIQLDPPIPPETTTYTVTKKWEGNLENRPAKVVVKLFKVENGNEIDSGRNSVELSEDNNWTYTWDKLPIGIVYIAREISESGEIVKGNTKYNDITTTNYKNVSKGIEITNIIGKDTKTEKIDITVNKVWEDTDNAEGKRPDSIKVRLYRNGEKVEDVTITNSNWSHTWKDLDKEDDNGQDYTYTVKEVVGNKVLNGGEKYNDDYYTVEYLVGESEGTKQFTIINKTEPIPPPPPDKTTKYTVIKHWEGNQESQPLEIEVKLFEVQNGNEIDLGKEPVKLSADNNWQYTWDKLPEGKEYVVRELSESGEIVKDSTKYNQDTTTTYNISREDKITEITNKIDNPLPPTTIDITVNKVWEDTDNAEGKRPDSIKVRLYRNDKKVEDVTITNSNWSYTWQGLTQNDENGNPYRYEVKELSGNKVIENGDAYNDDYKAYYLIEQNKTTITNKMPDPVPTPDLVISGMVWNDMALNKTQDRYDGYKNEEEKGLSGVKVMLHRVNKGIIATTYTNQDGEYSFTNDSLKDSNLPDNEKFIKGPRVAGTNRWEGTYYSYYVIFEYDGITYTSTEYAEFTSDNSLDSNARESEDSRSTFNKKFTVIKSDGAYNESGSKTCDLSYTTINENGYIPQSIINYNSSEMAMQSSTAMITLSNSEALESQIKHINLGLRGKDTFDLELTSDVHSTKVTVNNQNVQYNYNSNKVTIRRNDANNYNYIEDSANPYLSGSKYVGDSYDQRTRKSDIIKKAYENSEAYHNTGLSIEVTYRIKVTNVSKTIGTATKITNYFDDAYTFVKAYTGDRDLSSTNGNSGTGYKSVEITTPGTMLNQSESMEIYVVYKLNDPVGAFEGKLSFPTYNMAEITEYKTQSYVGTDEEYKEYTRGLIDKDSAPGSVNKENVRLHPNTEGTVSTLNYYFGNNDLSLLKYEDDTYATPTLYFIKDSDQRTITGIVFEDLTITDIETKIKTGDGKLNNGEVGVYGATVELIEQVGSGEVRFTTTTNENGNFMFENFLPGNYIIRYHYGDTENTVIRNKFANDINKKSYNGEDFQATNNSYDVTVRDQEGNQIKSNLLNTTPNYWYVYNETDRISTAIDNADRRGQVSGNVVDETNGNAIMALLNKARDLETIDDSNLRDLIEATKMFADTPNMILTVEKTELKEKADGTKALLQNDKFTKYRIDNMNFGIAEVPVTTIDLQKEVKAFTITDSTGTNIIASFNKENNEWVNVTPIPGESYPIYLEDEKLQGSRLQVTYTIKSKTDVELNFDKSYVRTTIAELVDIVDNNLSYNPKLGSNETYWEVYTESLEGRSSVEDIKNYATIIKAKSTNPLITNTENAEVDIILEKVLSAPDSTLEDIIKSEVEIYVYGNTVEITELSYDNYLPNGENPDDDEPQKDRIRIPGKRHIIIPGVQYDTASAEIITITPPTGDSSIHTIYYVMTAIGLAVLAIGVFGIKKYVIKK